MGVCQPDCGCLPAWLWLSTSLAVVAYQPCFLGGLTSMTLGIYHHDCGSTSMAVGAHYNTGI